MFDYDRVTQAKQRIQSAMPQFDEVLIIQETHRLVAENQLMNADEKHAFEEAILNAILKYDIIQVLLDDEWISEIMINGPDAIFIERKGALEKTDLRFSGKGHLMQLIQKIATEVGREVNYGSPIMDARLKDGSRVNVVLDPIAIDGPFVTIRKFRALFNHPDELIAAGMFPKSLGDFFEKALKAKYNFFICGGTGSGKTTFLNCMTSYIPKNERIVVIEDASEIQISDLPNALSLETRNTQHAENPVTMSSLIKNALRMRPDRIIVGEVRGDEALDMLQAMNTGHDGSMSTGHSNTALDMLTRLEVIASSYSEIHHDLIRRQIISAIDIIVYIERMKDGSRKVTEVSEILKDKSEYTLNPLFRYDSEQGNTFRFDHLINRDKLRRASLHD
jgi:pilus assembly protein CpaF